MLNYKRLTFIFIFTTIFLLATDTQSERQMRRGLLSFFNIVTEESTQVGQTAPSSFLDTLEDMRIGTYNFLSHQGQNINDKLEKSKGILSFGLSIGFYLVLFLKFIANYVITFYPFVVFLLYIFFTSRIFKKDDMNVFGNF